MRKEDVNVEEFRLREFVYISKEYTDIKITRMRTTKAAGISIEIDGVKLTIRDSKVGVGDYEARASVVRDLIDMAIDNVCPLGDK